MRRSQRRDAELARVLRAAESPLLRSDDALATLSRRISVAAAPLLDERAAPTRTVWDYAERWSATLLPIGALTAIAAGLSLFLLSNQPELAPPRSPGVRVALLGAATNRLSSQKLVEFLVAGEAVQPSAARGTR